MAISAEVYPRVCGGNPVQGRRNHAASGLSPRVRGKRWRVAPRAGGRGSIPACAGETGRRINRSAPAGVYPRVCGGNPSLSPTRNSPRGLSPRVRGKQIGAKIGVIGYRSIPACAGETTNPPTPQPEIAVYPRVCGGNSKVVFPPAAAVGSIPACAGETQRCVSNQSAKEVYPRVCGGNDHSSFHAIGDFGLSPRVRGKLDMQLGPAIELRSIPACAGETIWSRAHWKARWVYPRVCGGNRRSLSASAAS